MIHSFLYVANTDGIIRFPYRNGELKARAPAETTVAKLSGGAALLRSGGHWKRDILFSPNGKKMYVSIGSRSNDSDNSAEADGAHFEFNSNSSGQKIFSPHFTARGTEQNAPVTKIVRIPFDHSTGKPRGEYKDFVTGFVTPEGNV